MNWTAISFDWNHARAFLATAEEGSLSAAARALGLTQPTLGRQVSALEDELGVLLFERVGRGLVLTPAGQSLRAHVSKMRDAAEQVSLVATGQSEAIEGTVAVTASDIFSAYLLPPLLQELRTIAPKLRLDVVAANDLRDLQRREADIAIRHVRPQAPELIARKIATGSASFVAATSYLERRGHPKSLSDLKSHDFIAFGDPAQSIEFLKAIGLPLSPNDFPTGSANGIVAWHMVREGLGVTIMDDILISRTPEVEPLLPDLAPVQFPIWLTTHRELHTSAKIRLVFDMLAERIPKKARYEQARRSLGLVEVRPGPGFDL